MVGAGLKHVLRECVEWAQEREQLSEVLKGVWGVERWRRWTRLSWGENVAEILGLKGECSKLQREVVECFLEMVDEIESQCEEVVNWGCARTRGERSERYDWE